MNYNIIYENNMNYEIDIENNDLSTALIGDEIFSSIIEYTHCVGETIIYDEEKVQIEEPAELREKYIKQLKVVLSSME